MKVALAAKWITAPNPSKEAALAAALLLGWQCEVEIENLANGVADLAETSFWGANFRLKNA